MQEPRISAENLESLKNMNAVVQLGHSASVTSVAFSPDGNYVLTGSKDHLVKLWDIFTGRELQTLKGHSDVITSVAFTPDGRFVISSSWDKTIRLWDLHSGSEIRTFDKHRYKINAMVLSPDGNLAIAACEDNSIIIWRVSSGRIINKIKGHDFLQDYGKNTPLSRDIADVQVIVRETYSKIRQKQRVKRKKSYYSRHFGPVMSVAISPNNRSVLSGGLDSKLILQDLHPGGFGSKSFTDNASEVLSTAFSPNGRYALSGNKNHTLSLWKIPDGRHQMLFVGHTDRVTSVAFSPNGQFVLSGSHDQTMRLWQVSDGREIRSFNGHASKINAVAFSPDGRYAISGGDDHIVKLWEVATGRELRSFRGRSSVVSSVSVSPDGRLALSANFDHSLNLWDLSTGCKLRTYRGHSGLVLSAAFSQNGRYLLSGSSDKQIILWDSTTGRKVRMFKGHSQRVNCAIFSPGERYILSGSSDQTLKLWEVSTGREVRTFKGHMYEVTSAAISPDGNLMVSGSKGKTIKLWEVASGRLIRTFHGHFWGVNTVSFSPDGRFVMSGGGDKSLKLWDTATGRLVRSYEGHTGGVETVAFSPLGRLAVSGSSDSSIIIWEVSTGVPLKRFEGHYYKVNSVTFSPDGQYLISGSSDSTVRKWDIANEEEIGRMQASFDGEWITTTSDGYYMNSPEGTKFVHWVDPRDLVAFSYEQFEAQFKKPTIINARFSGNINAGKPAPTLPRPPKIELEDHLALKVTKENTYALQLKAISVNQVKAVRIFVNGIPSLEIPVNAKERNLLVDVPLFSGANRITVIAYDQKGFSSNPKYTDVTCEHASVTKPNLYVFAIGVSSYPGLPPGGWQLEFAHTDAQALINTLLKQKGKLFGRIRYNLLIDENASEKMIVSVFEDLSDVNENDLVIIFMAGHGVQDKDGTFYFLTKDANIKELRNGGLSWALMGKYISRIKARAILFLDACHSGSIATETVVPNDKLAQQFFSGERSGVMVFSASKGRQSSMESPDVGGGYGIFTYALVQGLSTNSIEVDSNRNKVVEFMELVDYVSNYVNNTTNGEQTPWLSRKELFGDLPLAVVE
jgi:WD40 repeat protein